MTGDGCPHCQSGQGDECKPQLPSLLNTMVKRPPGNLKDCPPKPAVPPQYSCYWPKIFDEFEALLKRQYCMQTKNPIIHKMALPKHYRPKYIPPCFKFKTHVQIRRLDERQPTRTQLLALPRVKDFLSLQRSRFYKTFPQIRKDAILRNMRKSYLSLYTYLSTNKEYCAKKFKREKPTKKQLRLFMARLDDLAAPKPVPEPEEPEREEGEISFKRLQKLATPKQYPPGHEKEPWHLKPRQRTYEATPKIIEMSRPKEFYPDPNNPDWDKVNPKALRYKATEKIKEMAQPVIKNREDANLKENPFAISPKALKARASARIREMAEPKEYDDAHNKPDPYAISRKALKAVASPRIIELAKPKQYNF